MHRPAAFAQKVSYAPARPDEVEAVRGHFIAIHEGRERWGITN